MRLPSKSGTTGSAAQGGQYRARAAQRCLSLAPKSPERPGQAGSPGAAGAWPAPSGDARLPAVTASEPVGSGCRAGRRKLRWCFLTEPGPLVAARARLAGPSGIWGLVSAIEKTVCGNGVWAGMESAVGRRE